MKEIAIELAMLLLLNFVVILMVSAIGFEAAVIVMLTIIWFYVIKGGSAHGRR